LIYSSLDVVQESSLNDHPQEDQFMSVGWGKKETQFHGSEGKEAAHKKEEFLTCDIENLDKSVCITWRGDGELFAVSFVGASGRMFQVFNKEGNWLYTSEKCSILEPTFSWRVSGNWIAKPQIYPDRYVITLFEKNGLRHQEIPLPFSKEEETVVNLSWSIDSEVLLIETRKLLDGQEVYSLYLYTICNYHWYLKQFLEFPSKICYKWSLNYVEPKMLHLIDQNGNFFTYKWDYVINKSNGSSSTDESIVAVIDDCQLLITNFRSQMVPPPMSSFQLKNESRVNFIGFLESPSENLDSNSFFIFDSKSCVQFYKFQFKEVVNGRFITDVEKIQEISLEEMAGNQKNSLYYCHPIWLSEKLFLVAQGNELILLKLEEQSFQFLDQFEFEKTVGGVIVISQDEVAIQFIDGSINLLLFTGESAMVDVGVTKFPEYCEKILGISKTGKLEIFGLKNIKKKLYLNDQEIGNEVTSFTITHEKDFLLYTTIAELKFLDLRTQVKNTPIYTRRVERGSKIVSLVKDKSQTIFQLPRGNLEVINPRILSLKIIKRHLLEKNYRLAFDLLRKERINLNLLLDLDPVDFFQNLNIFVEQIDQIQWLNLFLTELKNEDVTKSMYQFCEVQEIADPTYKITDKVEFVCQKMIELFQGKDPVKYLHPIITCHVKMEEFELALAEIWKLKQLGSGNQEADDAFKYLLYLIDINPLYNVALGMYDYNLVLFVAQKSQKDPKEYLPFLNELKKLDQHYARYKIDCYLKRFDKAIENISNLEDDLAKLDECLELIKKHSLYDIGMRAFRDKNQEFYEKICSLYGDDLRTRGKLVEASLMYERGRNYQQAASSARNVLDWQRCLYLSKKCGDDRDAILRKLNLVPALQENGRFQDAVDYLRIIEPGNSKLLIEALVKGKFFSKAVVEASLADNLEIIESYIKPEFKNQLKFLQNSIEDDEKQFQQQKQRLLMIRAEKVKKQQVIEDGLEDDDGFSDTTSLMDSRYSDSSKLSGKTFKSSKNRRKHERKLMNLKEGNRYEDIALIGSLSKLIQKIVGNDNQVFIRDMLKSAIELEMDEEGLKVQVIIKNHFIENPTLLLGIFQRSFRSLLLRIKESLDEIWIPEMMTSLEYPTGPQVDLQLYQNDQHYALISKILITLNFMEFLNNFITFQNQVNATSQNSTLSNSNLNFSKRKSVKNCRNSSTSK
jgi:elongator complex protein 1